MSWKLELSSPTGEAVVHENVQLKMGMYASHMGAVTLPHLVVYHDDVPLRALGFRAGVGMCPTFDNAGFSVSGTGSDLEFHESRDPRRAGEWLTKDSTPGENWVLSVLPDTE